MPNVTPNYGMYLPLVNDPTDQDLWGGYLNANFSLLDTTVFNISTTLTALAATVAALQGVPTGTGPVPFSGSVVPTGWLECNGALVSRATYAALFAAIGTTFGAGDGSTTFQLPTMARKVTMGRGGSGTAVIGNAIGNTGGEEAHAILATELPAHSHVVGTWNAASGAGDGLVTFGNLSGPETIISTNNSAAPSATTNVIQPSLVTMMIIKT